MQVFGRIYRALLEEGTADPRQVGRDRKKGNTVRSLDCTHGAPEACTAPVSATPSSPAAPRASCPPSFAPQVHAPAELPSRELLCLVHSEEYVDTFCGGTLGKRAAAVGVLKWVLRLRLASSRARRPWTTCGGCQRRKLPPHPAAPADKQRMRRIGFGEVARSRTLIDRTLAEVAGGC